MRLRCWNISERLPEGSAAERGSYCFWETTTKVALCRSPHGQHDTRSWKRAGWCSTTSTCLLLTRGATVVSGIPIVQTSRQKTLSGLSKGRGWSCVRALELVMSYFIRVMIASWPANVVWFIHSCWWWARSDRLGTGRFQPNWSMGAFRFT